MDDIATILQNAILYVAGAEGLAKFNKAGYASGIQKVMHSNGSLDLPKLMNILLDVFPEEQSSAIADSVLAKYVEKPGDGHRPPPAIAEAEAAQASAGPGVPAIHDTAYAPGAVASGEENLAKYLATESSDVRDLINEARRIRMAMGKGSPQEHPVSAVAEHYEPAHQGPSTHAASIAEPAEAHPAEKIAQLELGNTTLETEIQQFVEARKSYTSVDIMDFIRYLKDKGYHFQENIVLEKVYTWLEEHKNRERAALMADIQSFLEHMPWPSENDVSTYIDQKKSEGIVCDRAEIKRMILVEMIRKH